MIPYRDGYEFLGYSYEEGSDRIDVMKQYVEYKDYYGINDWDYVIIDTEIAFDYTFFKTLENDTVLYAVWKKIDN